MLYIDDGDGSKLRVTWRYASTVYCVRIILMVFTVTSSGILLVCVEKKEVRTRCWFNMEFETLRFDMVWRIDIFAIIIILIING